MEEINNYKKEKQTVAIMDSMDGSLDKLPEIKDPYKIKDIIEDLDQAIDKVKY